MMTTRIFALLLACGFLLTFEPLNAKPVIVSGLTVSRQDDIVTLTWKANVKKASFRIYRAGWQIRNPDLMKSALRIADLEAEGAPSGKLFRFPAYTDIVPTEEPYFYLVVPDQDSYSPSDFRPNDNLNMRPAVTGYPIVDRVRDGLRIRVSYIEFAWDRAEILPASGPHLDRIASLIKKILADPKSYGLEKTSIIEISGHADDTGTHAHNVDLSRRRAQAVKKEMVKRGLDGKMITTVGYAEWRPMLTITKDLTEEEKTLYRELNRRVEFYIRK
jgi:outer membrane protein OmpA-like peptidoglycan-associated protein